MARQRQIKNKFYALAATLAAATNLEANEQFYVDDVAATFIATTDVLTPNGSTVLATGTAGLVAKITISSSNIVVAESATFAGFPAAASNSGKFAILNAVDGIYHAGHYRSNGTIWSFVDVDTSRYSAVTAPLVTDDTSKNYKVGDIWVNTGVSPRSVYVLLDATTGAAVWEDISTVNNPVIFQGNWDASAGTFPGAGVAQTGYLYVASVAGTVDSQVFDVGDSIYATADNASTTVYAANWAKVEGVVTDAGYVIAQSATFAGFPVANAGNSGKFAVLTAYDTVNRPGLYQSDATTWVFVPIPGSKKVGVATPTLTTAIDGVIEGDIYVDNFAGKAYVCIAPVIPIWKQLSITAVKELIAVTAPDTLAALSQTPTDLTTVELNVNGVVESALTGAFTVVGTAITWVPATAGYNLATTDIVVATYSE